MILYRAVLPHYVCGFLVRDGTIADCAPIMGWARGKSLDYFASWAARKGGSVERV